MRMLPFLLFIASGLAGCASRHSSATIGNFLEVPSNFDEKAMADDVARKVAALYPPAHTSIRMRQATPDAFGVTLAAALRVKGYALAEFNAGKRDAVLEAVTPVPSRKTHDLALGYVVDQPLESSMYRVTVLLNEQSLSRLYQTKDGIVLPAGYWMRKE